METIKVTVPERTHAKPTFCPECGKSNIMCSVEWYAHSLELQDLMNAAVLQEFQCLDCAISFWL